MTAIGSIGLLAPTGTPRSIVDQIAQATRTALAEQAFRQMLLEAAMEPVADQSPERFRQMLADDVALWAPVVKAVGLKID
jgi:tripartite-type tricarboxylate transporter receptor subunit TctC